MMEEALLMKPAIAEEEWELFISQGANMRCEMEHIY